MEDIDTKDSVIKGEYLSDDEFEFEFSLDDIEYEEVLKELKATSDGEDAKDRLNLECPYPECNKIFTRQYNLQRHMLQHDFGNPTTGQVCHVCGKVIKGSYSLHLKIHDNVKQFSCTECGKEFRQKIGLANHMLTHKDERPYECQWCFKRFRQKYTLKDHTKKHTGVKDFICDLCGKEFTDKVTLQKHSVVHSTNKPHQCSICFMSFRHKSSLSRHGKIHSKPTQCHLCQKSFRYESFLKKHLQSAHPDSDNAFLQPAKLKIINNFSQDDIVEEYVDDEDEPHQQQQQQQYVEIAYDAQSGPQIVSNPQQFRPSTSSTTVIVNQHSYT